MKKVRTGHIDRTLDGTYLVIYRVNGSVKVYCREFWYKRNAIKFLNNEKQPERA
jgi:hypothetical protein